MACLPSGLRRLEIEILQAVPAAGKTKAILTHVKKTKRPTLIASISCQLSQQSFDYYKSIGGKDAAIIDTEHISRSQSVVDVLREGLAGYRVIFVTHAAILRYPDLMDMKGFELYIDEVPEFVELNEIRFTDNMTFISRYCDIHEGVMTLKPAHRKDMEKIANDGLFGYDAISASVYKLAGALLRETPVAVRENVAYFIDDATTSHWDAFRKVTIACANFGETFTGVVLKNYCKWNFKRSPLTDMLDFSEYRNSKRVEIIPVYAGDWSRYAADQEIGGESVYNRVKQVVYDLTENSPYIYTTNSYRTPLRTGEKVQYNPHGLNKYMSHSVAVALFSYNPMPWQVKMLKGLAAVGQLDEKMLIDAYIVSKYLEPVFQLCLRTTIRKQMCDHPVRLIVPDIRAADYLKSRYLKDCTIDYGHMVEPPPRQKKTERKTQLTFKSMFGFTADEQKRFYRYQSKFGRKLNIHDPKDVSLVRDWVCLLRTNSTI